MMLLLYFLILTADGKPLHGGVPSYSIEIIPYPNETLSYDGEYLFYECQQNVSESRLPIWIINETAYPSSTLPVRYTSIYDGIIFVAKSDMDRTTFRCCFIIPGESGSEEICSDQRVLKIASRIEIHSGPQNVTVIAGDEVNLECKYSGTGVLPLWLINDIPYATSDLPVIYRYEEDGIYFTATSELNGTTFQCLIWTYGPNGLYPASSGIGILTVLNDAQELNVEDASNANDMQTTQLLYSKKQNTEDPKRPDILGSYVDYDHNTLSLYWEKQTEVHAGYGINATTCARVLDNEQPCVQSHTDLTQYTYSLDELCDFSIFRINITNYGERYETFYFTPAMKTTLVPCSKTQYIVAEICGPNGEYNVTCQSSKPNQTDPTTQSLEASQQTCPDQVCLKQGSDFSISQCITFLSETLPPFSKCSNKSASVWCASAKELVNETLISYQGSDKMCCPSAQKEEEINCETERGSYFIYLVEPPTKPENPCLYLNYDGNEETVVICVEEPYTDRSYPILRFIATFIDAKNQKLNISFSTSDICQPLQIPELRNLSYLISMTLEAESEAGISESSDEADISDGNNMQFCNCIGKDASVPTLIYLKGNTTKTTVVVEITQPLLPAAFPPQLILEFCNLSLVMYDNENKSFSPNFTISQPFNCAQNTMPYKANLTLSGLEAGTKYTLLAQVPFVINGTKFVCTLKSLLIAIETSEKGPSRTLIAVLSSVGVLILLVSVAAFTVTATCICCHYNRKSRGGTELNHPSDGRQET